MTRVLSSALLAGTVFLAIAPVAGAACPPRTRQQYEDSAKVVVKGKFLAGPSAPDGQLVSPAAFRAKRYVKGDGPKEITVRTAPIPEADAPVGIVLEISPKAGERWRLPGHFSRGGVLKSTTCDGAKRLAA